MSSATANDAYTVGWICAIKTEYVAAKAFLDETHQRPQYVSPNDNNNYTLGRIGQHNVVLAVLPIGEYGIANAACVARDMLHSFRNVRIGLMVGIVGGVPTRNDIRLGDVVVSVPGLGQGGVLQYDFGKTIQGNEFLPTGFLDKPPPVLLGAVNGLAADYEMEGHRLEEAIDEALGKYPRLRKGYERRKPSSDRLYRSDVVHPNDEASCEIVCGDDQSSSLLLRPERADDEDDPAIHYGLIASANQLMKDALMEAAGLMNHFPCLVIRGICDYSDSHKNKEWQGYAAMTAAAYAKDLLCRVSPTSVETERRIVDILSDMKEKVEDVQEKVQNVHTIVHDQKHQALLDWLTPVDYDRQHNDFMSRRQESSGKWFLNSEKFQAWTKKKKGTLFCPGIPGAGKTIMTAIVISHLCQEFSKSSNTGIAYIYCNFQRQSEQKAENLLASLLKQLARSPPSPPKDVIDLYDRFQKDRIRPSFDEISRALRAVAAMYTRVFIIVDALDECDSSDNLNNRARFLTEIFALQAQSGANIFATSRNVGEISILFASSSILPISANVEDVEAYLDAQLAHLDPEIFDGRFLIQIKPKVLEAVDGMFLLAKLHIDLLAAQNTKGDVLGALESLGKGEKELYKTYEQTVERINSQRVPSRELAWRILEWIVFSKRPLFTAELQHALAVRKSTKRMNENFIPSSRVLQSVCAGLVTIDKESDIVRLDHYTIQEFFLERRDELFSNAASHITEDCVKYLSFDAFESGACKSEVEFQERIKTHLLYDYAGKNWGYHAYEASTPSQSVIALLKCEKKTDAISQILFCDEDIFFSNHNFRFINASLHASPKKTGLHVAAYLGLHYAVSHLLDFMHPDSKDEYGCAPLFWATLNGHDMVIKLLITKGAVNPEAMNLHGETALHIAAKRGHMNAIKIMLNLTQADPDVMSRFGRTTPLLCGAEEGHEDVIRVLLDTDKVDVNVEDGSGRTPLLHAAKWGHEAVVRLLLDTDKVDVNVKDGSGRTPLAYAAEEGHEGIVRLLLDNDKVDVDLKDGSGHTPLLYAAYKGHEGVIRLLLDTEKVDINVRCDGNGGTPLLYAATEGHIGVGRLLLSSDKEVDANAKDKRGHTVLWKAILWGNVQQVEFWLHETDLFDVNLRERNGISPLLFAASTGNRHLVELLLEMGADIEIKSVLGRTPLSLAAEGSCSDPDQDDNSDYEGIINLLLERGADFNTTDMANQTLIKWAAASGQTTIYKMLADRGSTPTPELPSQTMPQKALDEDQKSVLKLLLETGVDYGDQVDPDSVRSRLIAGSERCQAIDALQKWIKAHASDAFIEVLVYAAACIDHFDEELLKQLHPIARERYLILNVLLEWSILEGPTKLVDDIFEGKDVGEDSGLLYWGVELDFVEFNASLYIKKLQLLHTESDRFTEEEAENKKGKRDCSRNE